MQGGVFGNRNTLVVVAVLGLVMAGVVAMITIAEGTGLGSLGGLFRPSSEEKASTETKPPEVAPQVQLTATRLSSVDADVGVSGTGFQPGERVVVTIAGQDDSNRDVSREVGATDARDDGSVGNVVLPAGQKLLPGTYTLRLQGADSDRTVSTSFWVGKFMPYVLPSAYTGKPSDQIFITAGYFAPGETVSLSLDGPPGSDAPSYHANQTGDVETIPWTVPYIAAGKHSIFLTGERSLVPMEIQFDVQGYNPWVTLGSYASQVEETIDVSGHGFAPWEKINIYLNDTSSDPILVVTADNEGNFTRNRAYTMTKDRQGQNTFIFVGDVSRVEATAVYKMLASTPSFWLTDHAGPPGGWVGFIGQGFLPNETVHVYMGTPDTGQEVQTIAAGNDGSFQNAGSFTVPFGQSGKITLTAVGETSKVPVSTELEITTLNPWARTNPGGGSVGTQVHLEGHDFLGTEDVDVYLGADQSTPILTAHADNQGGVNAGPYAIPEGSVGHMVFTLVGQRSGARATATFDVVPR